MTIPATPKPPGALAAIQQAAKSKQLDWRPLASVAQYESGLNPRAVGDGGHAFGLFQNNNAGGTITGDPNPQRFFNPLTSASYAAGAVSKLGLQGKTPEQQIHDIVYRYERPADPAKEYAAALTNYRTRFANSQPQQAATPASLGSAPTGATAAPTLQSSLPALQAGFTLQRQTNQSALDALGAISGRSVQAQAAPDLASLLPQAGSSAQDQPGHISVPLKGPTPKGLSPQGQKAVELAKHYLGTKYVFGGASPKAGFDCSGLIQWTMAQLGVKIPRTAAEQAKAGRAVNLAHLEPGDALSFSEDGVIGHTGMYIGGGQFIQAPHTGDVVKISPLAGHYQSILVGARRFT